MRRARQVLRDARGYTLIELVTVMLVLLTVLGALSALFISGTKKELDLNFRSRTQIEATAALQRLRRDIHCAASASASASEIQLEGCGAGSVKWCALGSGTRYGLYRKAGTTCDTTGKLYADYLTSASVFTYTPAVTSVSLAVVGVDMRVNTNHPNASHAFRLADEIVLRNSLRG